MAEHYSLDSVMCTVVSRARQRAMNIYPTLRQPKPTRAEIFTGFLWAEYRAVLTSEGRQLLPDLLKDHCLFSSVNWTVDQNFHLLFKTATRYSVNLDAYIIDLGSCSISCNQARSWISTAFRIDPEQSTTSPQLSCCEFSDSEDHASIAVTAAERVDAYNLIGVMDNATRAIKRYTERGELALQRLIESHLSPFQGIYYG